MAFFLFRIIGYRKATIQKNLQKSFPNKSPAELAVIRRRFYRHFTDLIVETIKLRNSSKEEIFERMRFSNDSQKCLEQIERGAVVVLGHRGNWELANLFIAAKNIVEPIVVYKPLASARFEEWFRSIRTRFGSTMTPMKKVYEELEKPRDKPYAVYLVNDQSPNPKRAYWTTFLHQDTGVYRGAEIISRKYDIDVLFCDIRCVEGKRGHYEVNLIRFTREPHRFPQNALLEHQIKYLEESILEQPYNWLWSHRRWKHSKPNQLSPEQLLAPSDGWETAQPNF